MDHEQSATDIPDQLLPQNWQLKFYLMKSSLQPSSISTYHRDWNLSYQFLFHILPDSNSDMPVPPPTLALLIAYLFDRHYAASSFNTYVSTIGYSHKLASLPDTTKTFLIIQMLRGYKKIGTRLDSRLPLTLPILQGIISAASQIDQSFYIISGYVLIRFSHIPKGGGDHQLSPRQHNSFKP